MKLCFLTYDELTPELEEAARNLSANWQPFMLEDPVANANWGRFYDRHPRFQFYALDEATGELVAKANAVPTAIDRERLPDRGWDEAIERALVDDEPTVVSALQINVDAARQRQGLSAVMLAEMRRIAAAAGFDELVAPVRPTWKERYPLTPIERYARWVREDGLPLDPWLRVHVRAGGVIDSTCSRAMTIPGSVTDWEEWTGLRFPESGAYVVQGALVPVEIDLERDEGLYVEPGVWVRHRLGGAV